MTQAIYQGFVLSRQQLQVNGQLRLCYWLKSSQGLLKAWVEGEQALFFIKAEQSQTAQQLLANHQLNGSVADTELKHFDQSAMVILKFTSIKHYYEAKQLLSAHMPLYEEDIRHCDRYLMERFIRGAAWVKGRAKQKTVLLKLKMPSLKPVTIIGRR